MVVLRSRAGQAAACRAMTWRGAFAVTTALAAAACPVLATAAAVTAQGIGALARAAERPVLRAIDVLPAWTASKGKGVLVAVLDTGIDPSAPDLLGSVTRGPDYTKGANPPGYQPPHLHGTYIGSLIAGHGSGPGRGEGIIGVAPESRILSVRVILDDSEPGFAVYNTNASYYDALANGIRYAVRHGAAVINMSLGSPLATRNLRQAVIYAISHGVVVVAAAGNNGAAHGRFTRYGYPASFTGVISVAAVTMTGRRAPFSDRNSSVVVSAPGVHVPGDGPAGSYVIGSGTSPAAALVSGVAALIKARYPTLPPALVAQAIIVSTRRRPPGGYRTNVGFGEIDAAAALGAAARLARRPAGRGVDPATHFGGNAPGAIPVVHRDYVQGWVLIALAALGTLGLAVAVALLGREVRRRVKAARLPAPSGPFPDTQELKADLSDGHSHS